ncbi:MAG: hypothetical protein L6Q53_04180 [Candidatus Brocadia sinica]|nr:hypothetical protein [Candidatus Brocadia sinica]NUO05672.1 hypothetical protein [Candidatus Brocadia sinica]
MGYVDIYERFLKNVMIDNKYHIKLKDNTELIGVPTASSVCRDPSSATFILIKDNGEVLSIPFKSVRHAKQI